MTTTSNAVLPHNQTTEPSFIRRHQVTLTTFVVLVALVSGAAALRILVALNHLV